MKILKWFLINGIYAALVYFGLYENNAGALNVALFISWFTIIASFLLLSDESTKLLSKEGRAMPAWINVSFDLMIIGAFVWDGWWILSIFLMLSTLLTESVWIKVKESNFV